MMYREALERAGAEVLLFTQTGTYQGDWWALAVYNGTRGWVHGAFGSCSECDAFYSEFDRTLHKCTNGIRVDPISSQEFRADCPVCMDIEKRLIEFGKRYLDDMLTQEQAEAEASKNVGWDFEAAEVLEFIRQNREK